MYSAEVRIFVKKILDTDDSKGSPRQSPKVSSQFEPVFSVNTML
jgi:hypothetical protein